MKGRRELSPAPTTTLTAIVDLNFNFDRCRRHRNDQTGLASAGRSPRLCDSLPAGDVPRPEKSVQDGLSRDAKAATTALAESKRRFIRPAGTRCRPGTGVDTSVPCLPPIVVVCLHTLSALTTMASFYDNSPWPSAPRPSAWDSNQMLSRTGTDRHPVLSLRCRQRSKTRENIS